MRKALDSVQAVDCQSSRRPSILTARWVRMRVRASHNPEPISLRPEHLPCRARRVLDRGSIATAQQALALDPDELVHRPNVGLGTMWALLQHIEDLIGSVTAPFDSVDLNAAVANRTDSDTPSPKMPPKPLDFVEIVDSTLSHMSDRIVRVVVARFHAHTKSSLVAKSEGISRERVRQIEERFVGLIEAAVRRHGLLQEKILDDDSVDFLTLWDGTHAHQHDRLLYVSLARTVLTGSDSYVDVERQLSRQIGLLADELRASNDYILGRLELSQVLEAAKSIVPALLERDPIELWQRLQARLKAKEYGNRIVGRCPRPRAIIRALLREAGGPISIGFLDQQLRSVLASYQQVSYFDPVLLRNKLTEMEDVHIHAQGTASLTEVEPAVATKWVEAAVKAIVEAQKPYSLVRFLDENSDAPLDAYALASLLRHDARVLRIGRRLYVSAEYEATGPIRIAALVAEALSKVDSPLTRGELLSYVKERRDMICAQIENYFGSVPGLVAYTGDIVGLAPLQREVMLKMLKREKCVVSLLGGGGGDEPQALSALWLLPEEDPGISRAEELEILVAAKQWQTAFAKQGLDGLIFGMKENV